MNTLSVASRFPLGLSRHALLWAFCGVSLGAQASLVIEDETPYSASLTESRFAGKTPLDVGFLSALKPGEAIRLEQIGYASRGSTLSGFGKEVRFIEALNQIVPLGWTMYTEGGVENRMNQMVSWHGGRHWSLVLNGVLNGFANVWAVLDWDAKEVLLTTTPAKERHEKTPLGFTLTAGQALPDVLLYWAQSQGWTLEWRHVHRPVIVHTETLSGGLMAPGGALEQALARYGSFEVWVDAHGHHVIVR
jgi:hypothetical protein